MASRAEMEAYRKDVDAYVSDVDKEISELLARRRDAVDRYNRAVRTYNEETFFHQDTLPFYPTIVNMIGAALTITMAPAMQLRGKRLRKSGTATGLTLSSTI